MTSERVIELTYPQIFQKQQSEIERLRAALQKISKQECSHPAAFAELNCPACIAEDALRPADA